jgi:hypothetical protein
MARYGNGKVLTPGLLSVQTISHVPAVSVKEVILATMDSE